jgi:hypothetical protein
MVRQETAVYIAAFGVFAFCAGVFLSMPYLTPLSMAAGGVAAFAAGVYFVLGLVRK